MNSLRIRNKIKLKLITIYLMRFMKYPNNYKVIKTKAYNLRSRSKIFDNYDYIIKKWW